MILSDGWTLGRLGECPTGDLDVDGNVGGAHPVTVSDRCQPLDVRPEEFGEQLGLDLAQLRKDLGHLGNRAVVLADLLPGTRRLSGRHVPVCRQGLGQQLGRNLVGTFLPQGAIPRLNVIDSGLGHRIECRRSDGVGKLP